MGSLARDRYSDSVGGSDKAEETTMQEKRHNRRRDAEEGTQAGGIDATRAKRCNDMTRERVEDDRELGLKMVENF